MKKRVLSLAMAVLMLLSVCVMTSCGKTEEKSEASGEKKYVVGISQLVTHVALDAATQGFKDAVEKGLGKENVVFDLQNAEGVTDVCATIANSFVSKKVDLIMANGTGALQAAANATLEIPILGTSITEYGVALEIDNFNGTVGGNISGMSDLAPLDKQAQLILDWVKDVKKVGFLYCSAEPNSAYQVKEVRKYLEAKGITCTEYAFSDSNDATLNADKAAKENDALYIPTDNTAASCASAIYGAMTEKKPIIAGEAGICSGCGVLTYSLDYYDLGYATGEMAVKVLKGEADISTLAVGYTPEAKLTKMYNEAICKELGMDIEALKAAGFKALEQ